MSLKRMNRLLIPLALVGLAFGCSGVRLRPDGTPEPQACPREALEAMREVGVEPGKVSGAIVDATQAEQRPARLVEGPVVGYLEEPFGSLPVRTRLYGHIWTGGEKVIIRYYEAQPPDGRRIPFCAEAWEGFGGQMKEPDSPPGVALIQDSLVSLLAVSRYGEHDAIDADDRAKAIIFR